MTIPQRNRLAGFIGRMARSQRQQLKDLLAEGLTLTNKERTMWAVFLKDASHPGKFRYQLFNEQGFYYHRTFATLEQAFEDAYRCGFCVLDMGAMCRMFGTDVWKQGTINEAARDCQAFAEGKTEGKAEGEVEASCGLVKVSQDLPVGTPHPASI